MFGKDCDKYTYRDAVGKLICDHIGHAYIEPISSARDMVEVAKNYGVVYTEENGNVKTYICPRCKQEVVV
jgi:hypothetical protein